MIQQDTLYISQHADTAALPAAAPRRDGQLTPSEILSWLPSSATPAQQDSAIRAHIHIKEVDWDTRPNPLCTPETRADSLQEVTMARPMYHSRSLLNPDSIYRPEVQASKPGVGGDPKPFSIGSDNLISATLITCFVVATIAMSKSATFIQRQLKAFFQTHHKENTEVRETGEEIHFQLFLLLHTALLTALILFFYCQEVKHVSFALPNYAVMGLFMGAVLAYFALKFLAYTIVNWVFFDSKKNVQWLKSQLVLLSAAGVILFPIVLLMAYSNLSVHSTVIYSLIVVILVELFAFYKAYHIFFGKATAILQSFLYLCALEIMPLGALWGALVLMTNYLKVNF